MFALTAWLTLVGMWTGAGLTDRWLDRRPVEAERTARLDTVADALIAP